MIVPYYRKLTLYKINREFPKFPLILVALIYVNVYFRAVNSISVALISIILTPILNTLWHSWHLRKRSIFIKVEFRQL